MRRHPITGTFRGELSAATGSFTGTVTATTLNSANANITGGNINISTSDSRNNIITLRGGGYTSRLATFDIIIPAQRECPASDPVAHDPDRV